MDNFRIFVGVDLEGSPAAELMPAVLDHLSAAMLFRKWTQYADLHVTLHFLGDMSAWRVGAIHEAVREAAKRSNSFELALDELGTFGPANAPRILWCGVRESMGGLPGSREPARLQTHISAESYSEGSNSSPSVLPTSYESLHSLHRAVAGTLVSAGFELETRPFRPHVTLARNGSALCSPSMLTAAWREAVSSAAHDSQSRLKFRADRITIFRSHLGRRPSYERLAAYPLEQ